MAAVPDGAGDHMIKQLESEHGSQGGFVIIKNENEKKAETESSNPDATIESSSITQVGCTYISFTILIVDCTSRIHIHIVHKINC